MSEENKSNHPSSNKGTQRKRNNKNRRRRPSGNKSNNSSHSNKNPGNSSSGNTPNSKSANNKRRRRRRRPSENLSPLEKLLENTIIYLSSTSSLEKSIMSFFIVRTLVKRSNLKEISSEQSKR